MMDTEQLYSNILEGSISLIHSIKPSGSFEFVNQAWKNTLGYTEEETDEMTIDRIIFPEVTDKHKQMLDSVFNGEKVTDFNSIFVSKNGERVFVEGNILPRVEESEVVAAQCYYRDITKERKALRRIDEERKQSEFLLDLMLHDITNINQEVISTFEITMHHPDLPSDLKDIVEEGLEEVERASNLISNVRKISIIQEKSHSTERRDLGKAILDAATEVDSTFPTKKMKLNTNVKENEYFIMADEFLDDVFFALLHNSMKFDEKEEVEIDVKLEEISHTPFLRIDIKDRGPGIPEKDKEQIFAKVRGKREGILGLGLGLTLVKKVLENYGGQIRVEDRVQGDYTKGANFVILLRREYNKDSDRGDH
ncbi:MAG: MEKHLA domain-containing protein [Candidatus Thorarchaeota archaeon]|nr:MEKHLA domain-containing protein [Candidatus Thorarchaeota archaeon]